MHESTPSKESTKFALQWWHYWVSVALKVHLDFVSTDFLRLEPISCALKLTMRQGTIGILAAVAGSRTLDPLPPSATCVSHNCIKIWFSEVYYRIFDPGQFYFLGQQPWTIIYWLLVIFKLGLERLLSNLMIKVYCYIRIQWGFLRGLSVLVYAVLPVTHGTCAGGK